MLNEVKHPGVLLENKNAEKPSLSLSREMPLAVIPAKAGIQPWTPAYAGVTEWSLFIPSAGRRPMGHSG